MRLDRHYDNPKLEARRQALLRRQQADLALKNGKAHRHACRDGAEALLRRHAEADRVAIPAFNALLEAVRRSRLTDDGQYVDGLRGLLQWHGKWVRHPADWKPRSHNRRRQFSSLARHLLARYPVPAFMDDAWLRRDRAHTLRRDRAHTLRRDRAWFVHIGSGQNVRTAEHLPVPLTKRMAHEFLLAPDEYCIVEALRWGQARGAGVEPRLARALVGSRLGRGFTGPEGEPFWATVIHFFALHPMIDPHQVGPVVDYLHEQKFVPVGRIIENGTLVERGPPQPGLSMKGRTPRSLLTQVEAWHRRLARVPKDHRKLEWAPCGIAGMDRVEGEPGNQRRFVITELTSSAQLRAEGAEMHHCVYTYASSCLAARSAIYSLQADVGKGPERRLTVEVNVATRQIVQARGRLNAPPTQLDRRVLSAWAAAAGLTFGRYAVTRAY